MDRPAIHKLNRQITDGFIQTFKDEPSVMYKSYFAQLVAQGILPDGVDREHDGVREITEECKRRHLQ